MRTPGRAIAGFALVALLASAALAAKAPMPPGKNVTGTWAGELGVGGAARMYTLELHRRSGGKVMGYVLGGTYARTVTGGYQSPAGNVSFEVELADPGLVRTFVITGTVSGNSLVGTADDGSGATAIHWKRVPSELHERRFLFAESAGGGEPTGLLELSVVRRHGSGKLVSGGFVGRDGCGFLGCGGGVTSFSEPVDGSGNEVIAIGVETAGSCPGTGSLQATFDATTRFYAGVFMFTDCNGPRSGSLIGAKGTRTTSTHAARVLTTFARLADDLEAGAAFSAPYAPFSPAYLYLGETLADRLAELNDQVSTYSAIDVVFSRFRSLHTVAEPDLLPELYAPFGVDFHDRRSGVTGGALVVYRDADTQAGHAELKHLVQDGPDWVIYGNQIVHDLPLAGYSIGADHVVAPTSGGDIYVSIGPWGAHVAPHTGHLEGNAKADWLGLYARRLDQLSELTGDGDGVCEAGEVCGISQADLEARIVDFVAPADDFMVDSVRLERLHAAGEYYGSVEHWRVGGRVGSYSYDFAHLREISADLRNAMLAAGYVDPWTVHAPSADLITGAPVALNKGDGIARPQTVAEPVPGHAGFYTGKWSVPEAPWQQMEFFTRNSETSREESFYTWLAPALEAQLAGVLQVEGLNPLSFRYHQPFLAGIERMWRAEMALSNQEGSSSSDYSSLFSALGGWWETTGGTCDGVSNQCDELFSIFPIRKDTAFYAPASYHGPGVSYLAVHRFRGEVPPTRFGEVITPGAPDPVAGTLVFEWRDFTGALIGYQGASYRVDATADLLRIRWGPTVAAEGAVVPPAVPGNAEACDGTTLTCHDHESSAGNL